MKLGLVTYNIAKDWDLPTVIANCEATGFEGVELRTTHGHGVEPSLSAEERAKVRETFANTSVKLVGLGSCCEYHSPDKDELQRNIEETRAFVDLADDLGCPGVKVRPNSLPEEVPVEDTLRQIGLALRECAEHARHKHIRLRLEVHGRGTCHVPHIRTVLDIANHENLSACWNCNPTDVVDGSVTENFGLLRGRIGLVHLHDFVDTDYPYKELFELLYEAGWHGYCLMEAAATSDPIRVMRYMRALWDAYMERNGGRKR